jgi:hypothetical protein
MRGGLWKYSISWCCAACNVVISSRCEVVLEGKLHVEVVRKSFGRPAGLRCRCFCLVAFAGGLDTRAQFAIVQWMSRRSFLTLAPEVLMALEKTSGDREMLFA